VLYDGMPHISRLNLQWVSYHNHIRC